jgi:hypothetical protein
MKSTSLVAVVSLLAPSAVFADDDGDPFGHEHAERHEAHEAHLYGSHDACEYELVDPVPTPFLDVGIDDQRAACLRTEVGIGITTHFLVDPEEFHGHVGGDAILDLRHVFHRELELGARVRLIDVGYVQTAVNKEVETQFGPVLLSAAWGRRLAPSARVALVLAAELPYTRNERETTHSGGELTALVTGALSEYWTLHGRLGALAAIADSEGGTLKRLGMRAGFDIAWRSARSRIGLISGLETQAGFTGGLDILMFRQGFQLHVGKLYRLVSGAAVRLTGNDHTNVIFHLGVAREL